uniref:O-acyltransferase like protein-like n=1 Tax=Oryzias melastigma TaxID=30732 RepID=A0A3B3D8A4_ORYME
MAPGWVVVLLLVKSAVTQEEAFVVSERCMKDTNTFLWEIQQDKPNEYVVRMFDAFGKMGSNVEAGNVNQPGAPLQCRSAVGPAFSGKYYLPLQGAVQYFVGICVPDSCGEEDVKSLVTQSQSFKNVSKMNPAVIYCYSMISLFMFFFINRQASTSSLSDSTPSVLCFPQSCVYGCLQAFSLQTTSQSIFSSSSSSSPHGGYSSLNGIRVLSLLWIICGHSAQFPVINNLDNYKTWRRTVESSSVYVLAISGPVFLAVDSFLLLGGLLSARSLLSSIDKAEDNLSAIFPSFHVGCRVQPLHLFTMCLTISLISLVPWGPYWFPFIDTMMDCKSYWWANLLLISNLIPVHDICIPWTWYLSLDFQCYTTTPLLVFLYRLNKRVFIIVAGSLLLMTTVAIQQINWTYVCFTRTSENYVLHYYVKPYTRYGPFLIGIMTGIHLKTKKKPLLRQKAALGWFCCLSVMALLVGLAYVLRETPAYPSLPHALYQALHRPVWALSVSWIILACEEGYGGFITNLLSLSFWVPLSNISFACYLVHPIFIILYNGLQETPIHYTDINFMYLFFGHLVLTLALSYILSLLVEKPYLLLKWGKN